MCHPGEMRPFILELWGAASPERLLGKKQNRTDNDSRIQEQTEIDREGDKAFGKALDTRHSGPTSIQFIVVLVAFVEPDAVRGRHFLIGERRGFDSGFRIHRTLRTKDRKEHTA